MRDKSRRTWLYWLGGLILVILIVGGYFAYPWLRTQAVRINHLRQWLSNPAGHADWAVKAGEHCGEAVFALPTSGYIGFLWGDEFRPGHPHQGIDIFGGEAPGKTPVLAAYPGYLTRLPDWKSTVIIRIPSDPLHPGQQIWAYYTHMADENGASYISPDFPPGTNETRVQAGTFLGYQGDYSGDPAAPVGVHLHFSMVKDDGQGSFRNELLIGNTLDPSPYLGLPLNARQAGAGVVTCANIAGSP